jgi:5S rRNA maturation endonuclease (ribonuclease M5)
MNLSQEIYKFLTDLRKISKNVPIIVEGKRDKQLLSRFGIKNVLTLSGKNYFDLIEEIPENVQRVVLLVDIDPQGEKIFKKLKRLLEQSNIEVEESFRERFKSFGVKEVEKLEELIFGKS